MRMVIYSGGGRSSGKSRDVFEHLHRWNDTETIEQEIPISDLMTRFNEIIEENKNLINVNKEHQEINGKLRVDNDRLRRLVHNRNELIMKQRRRIKMLEHHIDVLEGKGNENRD